MDNLSTKLIYGIVFIVVVLLLWYIFLIVKRFVRKYRYQKQIKKDRKQIDLDFEGIEEKIKESNLDEKDKKRLLSNIQDDRKLVEYYETNKKNDYEVLQKMKNIKEKYQDIIANLEDDEIELNLENRNI